ncbi:hypothetical protein ACP70R_044925 [Stipagrostis hirtigluma subsp. patula]
MGQHLGLSLLLSGPNAVDAKLAAAVVDIHTRDVVTGLDLRCAPRGAVFAGVPQLTDNAIDFATKVCRNLKSVCLINCLSLTDEAAMSIALNCPALTHLMLFQSRISDDGISQIAKQCTNLNSLHIQGSLSITEVSLKALVQDARRLASLTLRSCPQIKEDAIMSFLMEHPYLDKLVLKGMMAGESTIGVIPAYRAMSDDAELNGARQSSVLHRRLCLFRQLRCLALVKCPGLNDLSMLRFADIHFRMLRHLVIDDCRGVTQRGLMILVGHVMNPMKLKTIKLARFHFFTYAGLMEVLSLLSETIESIILDSCDFGLVMPLYHGEAVALECPKLKAIRLEHCESILNLFLAWVDMACCGLKELRLIGSTVPGQGHDISGCFFNILHKNRISKIELTRSCQVTDIHVCIIAQYCKGDLQELILDDCSHFLGNSVMFLRADCPNLIKLGLSRTQIDDDKIRILMAVGLEHLEEVNLMGCLWITDITMHILASSFLPKLRRLNVAGCPHVTRAAVDYYQRFWNIAF